MTAGSTQVQDWILIRGLIRARFHWGDFPQQLLNQLPAGTRLHTPEVAGNGERFAEKTPFSIHAMMHDVRQQCLQSGSLDHGPVVIVAISMGAMIAAEWARCFPGEIRALHLINTSFSNLSSPISRMRAGAFFGLWGAYLTGQSLESAILRWTSNQPQTRLAGHWEAYAESHPLSLRNALAQLLSASSFRGPEAAPCPAWCYTSLGDRLVNPECTARIAHLWQVPLATHPSAGHDLPLDDSAWLIHEILNNAKIENNEGLSAANKA
ncbi:alpha/beta fold hydrolase [Thalassolituus sp. LLYu03]|uniref:alpha/beta fold hydrolase n=1 Tax=Thalassolituus sp. LLYu03 TaxID=3421656 RepID=UPI003D2AF139